jgi:uncharacterized protein YndB with AHSA1/START domain
MRPGSFARFAFALSTAFACAAVARAAGPTSEEGGFMVHESALVKANPDAVWAALVQPARWWSREHSWSGDSANLVLEPRAGGCFCETLPKGGSAEHMHVIQSVPGTMLRMKGALGPLQSEAIEGVLTIELTPGEQGTTISWTYVVGGYFRLFEVKDIAPAVDSVMREQSNRLAGLVDFGDPGHKPQP